MTIKDTPSEASEVKKPQVFYALPLRDTVIFPKTTITVLVGRSKSIKAVQGSKKSNIPLMVVAQNNPDHDEFKLSNIYEVGTLCNVVEAVKTSDGTLKVVIQGLARAKINKIISSNDFCSCEAEVIMDKSIPVKNEELLGLLKGCVSSFNQYSEYNKKISPDSIASIAKARSAHDIANMITPFLNIDLVGRQNLLAENDVIKKLYNIYELLQIELSIYQTEAKITKNIQEKIAKSQKDLYLGEQLKYIKKELGQDEDSEIEDLKKKISKLKLPEEVDVKCKSELSKLEKTNPFSSEAGVVRNYLEWIANLPWSKTTPPNKNLQKAQKTLDHNHYALQKIKDRILEFIAVQIKTNEIKGPILCLVGAPGVGKTSLARSIADALGRHYVKVSLGGVRDESEIRGHRRTYIGSMPGRIIQSMKRAKFSNPLMLLDEIDKMSYDMRGDPSSALLEVLDPEQNKSFNDHYLEVDYDLSKVMFVATANNINSIPTPLKDRMEIIRLTGYTENEKLQIAKKHLLPKQRKEHGLNAKEFAINDQALTTLIRRYTFEAGVRNLSREIANVARKSVREIVDGKIKQLKITDKNLNKYSGPAKFHYGIAKEDNQIGIATGLAYTDFGGDLLDIEVLKFTGSGKIQITGKLGDVMQESANIALSYVRSIADELKINYKEFNKYDFHIHVPEGATPKDGPSAGVALSLALLSRISSFPVDKNVAVTGEVTLNGKVLEIGGLKEKLLSALRGGIKTVLIPQRNEKDLEELPKEVVDNLEIKLISNIREAFDYALIGYKNRPINNKKEQNKQVKKRAKSYIKSIITEEVNPLG